MRERERASWEESCRSEGCGWWNEQRRRFGLLLLALALVRGRGGGQMTRALEFAGACRSKLCTEPRSPTPPLSSSDPSPDQPRSRRADKGKHDGCADTLTKLQLDPNSARRRAGRAAAPARPGPELLPILGFGTCCEGSLASAVNNQWQQVTAATRTRSTTQRRRR